MCSSDLYSVIGTGAFTDGGVAVVLDGRATLTLQKGTIKMTIRSQWRRRNAAGPVEETVVSGVSEANSFSTCSPQAD